MTTLILTPTQLEFRRLEPLLSPSVRDCGGRFELCGFGAIAAAARTMQLVAMHRPTQVILVGIAGSLRPDFHVGTARTFPKVACVGIGAGTGDAHKSASEMGWKYWDSGNWETGNVAMGEADGGIGDVLPLAPSRIDARTWSGELLTVCAASANDLDVARRLQRYPNAVAEDMEGFGVAVACYFGGVPLQIIRGISNRAGDRDQNNWNIDGALHAAGELTRKILAV